MRAPVFRLNCLGGDQSFDRVFSPVQHPGSGKLGVEPGGRLENLALASQTK